MTSWFGGGGTRPGLLKDLLDSSTSLVARQLAVAREEDDENSENSHEDTTVADDEDEEDVLRDTVIQHLNGGECCSTETSPEPRQRLGARSLPGRSIEDRNISVDTQRQGRPVRRTLPGRLAVEGDVIRYFTEYLVEGRHQWLRATVQHMTLTQQRLYPSYYNILNEQGVEMSIELLPGKDWQILRGEEWEFMDDGEDRPA